MKPERVSIPSGEISLEGVLHLPECKGPFPGVVVTHPHPLYGGDMESNVVLAVCEALVEKSIAALRFNFRGVGGSGGSYGGGVKEQDDVKATLDYLSARREIDTGRLGLAGYSFGGAVAFAVAQAETRVMAIALVSPALRGEGWEQLAAFGRPKLVLLGEADTVVPRAQWQKYTAQSRDFQVIPAADHFWWGCEEEIERKVGQFLGKEFA